MKNIQNILSPRNGALINKYRDGNDSVYTGHPDSFGISTLFILWKLSNKIKKIIYDCENFIMEMKTSMIRHLSARTSLFIMSGASCEILYTKFKNDTKDTILAIISLWLVFIAKS